MASCPEPGDDMGNPAAALVFGINVGMRLAADVGTGLALVNALRDRFPDAELAEIGQIATTIGVAVREASNFMSGPGDATPDLPGLPVVPPGLVNMTEAGRVIVRANVDIAHGAGEPPASRSITLALPEDMTRDEIEDIIQEAAEEYFQTSPEFDPVTKEFLDIIGTHINFLAKRY